MKYSAIVQSIKRSKNIANLLTDLKSVKIPYGALVANLASSWVDKYPEAVAKLPFMFGSGSLWAAQDLKGAIGLFNAEELKYSKTGVLFGTGSVAGILNVGKIKRERNYNVLSGYSCFAGIVNTGKISQEGEFNFQVGIGGLLGVANLGVIKTEGTSVLIGLSKGAGIINAGSINLTEGASGTIGAGLLRGILNFGTFKTGDNADVVAGISGGAGIVNGLAPDLAATNGITSGSLASAVISTGAGDDIVLGSGQYNVTRLLDSQTPDDFGTDIIDTKTGLSSILTSKLIDDLKLKVSIDLSLLRDRETYAGLLQDSAINIRDLLNAKSNELVSNDAMYGIINNGFIDLGTGNDTLFGAGDDTTGDLARSSFPADLKYIGSGILNSKTGTILLGQGNDHLVGQTWASLAPADPLSPSAGIVNFGTIDTGDGNDRIKGFLGISAVPLYYDLISLTNIGIINNGTITTGAGDDIVDALTGGFSGSGLTDLGEGNDTLIGFGTGTFNAGVGDIDKLLLGDGVYSITKEGTVTTIMSSGVAMITTGFESISGSDGGDVIVLPGMGMSYKGSFAVQDGFGEIV